MPEIPDLAAQDEVRRDPKRQRRRTAKRGFALGVACRGLGNLWLVKQIDPGKQPVFQKFEIGVDGGFEFEIAHTLAAGLVNPPHRRLDRQRHRKRIVRGPLDRKIAQFRKGAAQGDLALIVEIGDATDMMCRSQRAELDLDERGRRKFKLVFGLGRGIVTIALAEPADGVDRDFLLTLKADAGAGGKSKNILGLEVVPGACIVGARGSVAPKQTADRAKRKGMTPSKLYRRAHLFSHPPYAGMDGIS